MTDRQTERKNMHRLLHPELGSRNKTNQNMKLYDRRD